MRDVEKTIGNLIDRVSISIISSIDKDGFYTGGAFQWRKSHIGRITKTGNAHVRYVVVESSWHYRHDPRICEKLKKRQVGISPEIRAISWKAQQRLNKKFRKMVGRGKPRQVAAVAVAVGRELLGFIWAIANQVEKEVEVNKAA
jgi:hypothetical protein